MWRPESVFEASGHLDEGVIHAWLDEALVPESAAEVAAHAASCAVCAARVAEARGLIAGAGRMLGALDEASGVGRQASGAPLGTVSPFRDAKDPRPQRTPYARRATPRVVLAAAAVFVFAAGLAVLREFERGGGAEQMVFVDTVAESAPAMADSVAGTAPAAPAAPAPAPAATSVAVGEAAPPRADDAIAARRVAANAAAPAAKVAPAPLPAPPMAAPASRAPDAAVGQVAGVSPTVQHVPAATPAQLDAVPVPPPAAARSPMAARDTAVASRLRGVALEAVVTTAMPSSAREADFSSKSPAGAVMGGCWRLNGSDTLLTIQGSQVLRIVGASAVELRASSTGDSTVVSGWASGADLVVHRGEGDTLRARVVRQAAAGGEAAVPTVRLVRVDSAACPVRPR